MAELKTQQWQAEIDKTRDARRAAEYNRQMRKLQKEQELIESLKVELEDYGLKLS
jgi:hypothetical protein